MRFYFCFLLIIVLHVNIYAQQDSIYAGIPQTIKVPNEKYYSSWNIISTTNGKIYSTSAPGYYEITPAKKGIATVYVSRLLENGSAKFLDSLKRYTVLDISVSAYFNGLKKGEIDASSIYWSSGPDAIIDNPASDNHFIEVYSFRFRICRDGKEIYNHLCVDSIKNASFDKATDEFLKTLHNNDKIMFEDIICRDHNKTNYRLKPLEFTVKNQESLRKVINNEDEYIVDPITEQSYLRRKRY